MQEVLGSIEFRGNTYGFLTDENGNRRFGIIEMMAYAHFINLSDGGMTQRFYAFIHWLKVILSHSSFIFSFSILIFYLKSIFSVQRFKSIPWKQNISKICRLNRCRLFFFNKIKQMSKFQFIENIVFSFVIVSHEITFIHLQHTENITLNTTKMKMAARIKPLCFARNEVARASVRKVGIDAHIHRQSHPIPFPQTE